MFPDPFFLLEREATANPLPGTRVTAGGIEFGAAKNGTYVRFGGGKIHGGQKFVSPEVGGLGSPSAGPGDAGVVLGEAKDFRSVGPVLRPPSDGPGQIPGSHRKIGFGVIKIRFAKRSDAVDPRPIPGSSGSHLHETDFTGVTDRPHLKVAFPPNDRFDEWQGQSLFRGRFRNKRAHFLGPVEFP